MNAITQPLSLFMVSLIKHPFWNTILQSQANNVNFAVIFGVSLSLHIPVVAYV